MVKDFPLFMLAVTIGAYWSTVALLVLFKHLRYRQSAGVLPRQPFERWLWRLMVPVVATWIVLPILAGRGRPSWLALPVWVQDVPLLPGLRWAAAAVAVVGYGASVYCWLLMGRSWSMAVVPQQETRLVTEGVYRWVRHPIYSLSVLLMIASVVVLPTGPMALLAGLHLLVMSLKARHEERHLAAYFGTTYTRYCQKVGRFWPRWSSLTRRGS